MTVIDVLGTVKAALQDDDIGIAAKVAVLAAEGAPLIPREFVFGQWAIRSNLQVATAHSIVVRPSAGADEITTQERGLAEGAQQLQIAVAAFGADEDALQDTVAVLQVALLMVLDELVEYSRRNRGTIIDIADAVRTTYGEFDGGAASGTRAGFVCRITLNERSAR